jgi:ABC-type multidrug transport system fused ATPase/permease subunit
VSFFDTTPIGRILNRFSKDTDDMDYALPQSITELGNCLMQLAATLIFISIIQPWFLCGMVPLMVFYYFLQGYYRRSYVELQRTDATSRSPVYAHFSESLTGVETIRAYGYQKTFALKSDHQIDYNHKAYWALKTADQWLSLRLDVIGSSLIFLTAILAVANRRNISPALAALSLSEVLDVTGFMKYAVQSAAMFESRFNSVERLLAYRKLEPEAPRHIEGKAMPPSWPQSGGVGYNNVWMKYRPELEPVLKGVSFKVAPGEKVGIVGRTGSGKSSLIVTLFRLVEAYEGSITLDGQDLLGLGLEDVRSRIAAIPQDPALFSGTVRSNLDPYDRHDDAELWEALGHVALKDIVAALPLGLSARVAEGGDNFSMGQRQLLCVARALLRKPKVLVADEATASVDGETDALIQRTIRANFKDSTVLTIAHRLNTILDSTKVLVMEDGKVKEFDSPANLMNIPNGVFRAMVTEAGLAPESSTIQADAGTLDAVRRLSSELMSGELPSQQPSSQR